MKSAVPLQLALLVSGAFAFFPYTPAWLKEQEDVAPVAERKRDAAAAAAANANAGVSFAIEQRENQEREHPAVLASRQAARLKSKFQRAQAAASVEYPTVKRSGNSYSITDAAEPTQSMAAGILQDGTDYSHFVKVQLGSKAQQVYLLLDTGAGSSWTMSSTCTDKPCTMHDTFAPSDSSTSVTSQKTFSVSYGSGNVKGNLVTDTISLAGISLNLTFGLASQVSDDFTRFAFDGVLGLSMSQGATDNFLKTLADSKKLEKNLFGVALSPAADGTNQGEIRFGAINPDKFTGDIGYTSVGSSDGDWSIPLDDMAYDGHKAGCGGVSAYIDTGTSFIFGPSDLVKKLHAVIPGSASADGISFTVPCDSDKALTFTFSGVDYKVSPRDWISPKDSSGQCTSNIYGQEVVNGAWLLGDTFLKNVYSVFDRDQKRIGFAVAASSQSSTSSSQNAAQSTTSSITGTGTGIGTASTLVTASPSVRPSESTMSSLGLGGHETGGINSAAKPTQTSTTAAATAASAAVVPPHQHSKVAMVVFLATVIAMLV